MNKQQLAKLLNGREMGEEIDVSEEKLAKDNGLVVVFGYSDDNIEFRGAIDDEIGCYVSQDGGYKTIKITKQGILPVWEDVKDDEELAAMYIHNKKNFKEIRAFWGKNDYSWSFKTVIPHVCFDILEGEEKFCKGIVFDIKDL